MKKTLFAALLVLLALPALAAAPDLDFQNPSLIVDNYPRQVSVTARNDGDADAVDCEVTISLPSSVSLYAGANPQDVGDIEADGGKKLATWTLYWPTCQFMQNEPVTLYLDCANGTYSEDTVIWCWN
jgi:hypothetical protein